MIITSLKFIALLVGIAGIISYFRSIARVILLNRPQPDLIEQLIRGSVVLIFHRLAKHRVHYEDVQKIQAWIMPVYIIAMIVTWFLLVQISFSLVLWGAQAEPDWDHAFSASGSALTTLGYFTPSSFIGKFLGVYEAAIGLAIVMLIFTFVPGYQSAIQARERKVGWLYARTGKNPHVLSFTDSLQRSGEASSNEMWHGWENWFRGIYETHSLSPVLAYVPSVYEGTNWVKASTAVLDTTSLLLSCVDDDKTDSVRLCRQTGIEAVSLIASHMNFPRGIKKHHLYTDSPQQDVQFEELYTKLQTMGLSLKADKEKAKSDYYTYRAEYEQDILRIHNSTLTNKH